MSSCRLQGSQQGYQEIYMAHAQSRGYIFQTKWSYIFYNFGPFAQDTITFPWISHLYPKLPFNSPFRKYEYIKVPFSLAQAPAYFQELMDRIYSEDFPFAIAYLDDIIMVFEKLKTANLSMRKSKCIFFLKEIQYLGHILSTTGIRPLPSKTHAIQHMNPPRMPKHSELSLDL